MLQPQRNFAGRRNQKFILLLYCIIFWFGNAVFVSGFFFLSRFKAFSASLSGETTAPLLFFKLNQNILLYSYLHGSHISSRSGFLCWGIP